MEFQVEKLVNEAINFLLDMPEYKIDDKMKEVNPHIKVDVAYYERGDSDGDSEENDNPYNIKK